MITQTSEGSFLGVDLSAKNGVEKIIAMKAVSGTSGTDRYYQVQWHPTWVPEDSLTRYCSHLIHEYEMSNPLTNQQDDGESLGKSTPPDGTNLSHEGITNNDAVNSNECNGAILNSNPVSEALPTKTVSNMLPLSTVCATGTTNNDAINSNECNGAILKSEALPTKTVSNMELFPAVALVTEAPPKQNEIETTGVRRRKTRMPLKAETKCQVSQLPSVRRSAQSNDQSENSKENNASVKCLVERKRKDPIKGDEEQLDLSDGAVLDAGDEESVPDDNEIKETRFKQRGRKPRKLVDAVNKLTKRTKKETELNPTRKRDGGPVSCEKCGSEYTKSKCPSCSLATCKVCGVKYNNTYYREKCRACTNKCKHCGQSFRKPSDLVKHMEAIHERIKKYHCAVCSKGFAAKQYLTAHMESHKVEANHVCPICNKKYKTGRRLNRHKKTHTGEKPYSCPVCLRTFLQKVAVKTHMLTHSDGPKRFQCLLCKKGFNHKVSLKSHMLKHHDKNEQQAAVMIGLWKKYQKDEGGGVNMQTNQDEVLTRALSAVAMTPLDNERNVCPTNPTFPFIDFGQI